MKQFAKEVFGIVAMAVIGVGLIMLTAMGVGSAVLWSFGGGEAKAALTSIAASCGSNATPDGLGRCYATGYGIQPTAGCVPVNFGFPIPSNAKVLAIQFESSLVSGTVAGVQSVEPFVYGNSSCTPGDDINFGYTKFSAYSTLVVAGTTYAKGNSVVYVIPYEGYLPGYQLYFSNTATTVTGGSVSSIAKLLWYSV